jgi:hypothetical protein
LKRQVDWLVNGSLTGPIFSRALNQLTQLEIFPARDKDWPVNERYLFSTVNSCYSSEIMRTQT